MTFYNNFPTLLTLDQYIKGQGSIINHKNPKRPDIIKKWYPILETTFDSRLDESIMGNICVFCEVAAEYYSYMRDNGHPVYGNEVQNLILGIKKTISNRGIVRSAVLGKVFNYSSGSMEYVLEDGNFVKIKEEVSGPRLSVSKDIFPEEFVKHIDISLYRDMKIDEII